MATTEDDYSALMANNFTSSIDLGIDLLGDYKEDLAGKSNQNSTNEQVGQGAQSQLNLRYPKQRLDASADYLSIISFDYKSNNEIFGLANSGNNGKSLTDLLSKLTSKADAIEKILDENSEDVKLMENIQTIYLPIPQNVSDNMSVGYAEDTLNPLQVAGLGVAKTLGDAAFDKKARDQVFTNLKSAGVKISQEEQNALTNLVATKAINQFGANVRPQSIITRASGQILQSNLELLFNNVTLRSFPFSFDFVPRNADEANEVAMIIRAIKQGMAPKKGENPAIFIKSPKLFKLAYMRGSDPHPFLNKMKTGVITDMSVNYTGSNTYATYDDGTPVHMTMQFTFKEINPIYNEDYDIGGTNALAPGTGVGY